MFKQLKLKFFCCYFLSPVTLEFSSWNTDYWYPQKPFFNGLRIHDLPLNFPGFSFSDFDRFPHARSHILVFFVYLFLIFSIFYHIFVLFTYCIFFFVRRLQRMSLRWICALRKQGLLWGVWKSQQPDVSLVSLHPSSAKKSWLVHQ